MKIEDAIIEIESVKDILVYNKNVVFLDKSNIKIMISIKDLEELYNAVKSRKAKT